MLVLNLALEIGFALLKLVFWVGMDEGMYHESHYLDRFTWTPVNTPTRSKQLFGNTDILSVNTPFIFLLQQ